MNAYELSEAKKLYIEEKSSIMSIFCIGIEFWNKEYPNKSFSFDAIEQLIIEEYRDEGYGLFLILFNDFNRIIILKELKEISEEEALVSFVEGALPLIHLADKIREFRKLQDTINWIMKEEKR